MFFRVSIVMTNMLDNLKRIGVRKSVLVVVLIPYMCLLGVFHSRLNSHVKTTNQKTGDVAASTRAELSVRNLWSEAQRIQQRQLQRAAASRLVSMIQKRPLKVPEKASMSPPDVMPGDTDRIDDEINAKTDERIRTIQAKDVRFPAGEAMAQSEQRTQPFFTPSACLASHSETSFQSIRHLYVYSAYYDDRRRNTPYIRVIALAPSHDRPPLFCHFVGRENRTTAIGYYEMCENHNHRYGGWILSCPVPFVQSPSQACSVIISTNEHSTDGGVALNVVPITTASAKRRFGICVPPLFGNIAAATLAQFIELTKLLGAQYFYFYAHNVRKDIEKVLRYHERNGTATVIRWVLPTETIDRVWYHGQLLAINDCLYRGMRAFKYLAFNDVDEFIVPHAQLDWNTLLRAAQMDPQLSAAKCSGYSFQSAFFDRFITDDNENRIAYNLASDLRTKAFSRIRSKVIVESRKIFELGIHHISKPIIDRYQPCPMNSDLAFVHHYRKCTNDFEPDMNCAVFKRDNSTLRYAAKLKRNVKNIISAIRIRSLWSVFCDQLI